MVMHITYRLVSSYICMLLAAALLHDGPAPHVAPAWINWAVDPSTQNDVASSDEEDLPDLLEDDRWVPFLQPRRKRARCCEQRPRNRGDDSDSSEGSGGETPVEPTEPTPDEENEETSDEPEVFPYPVGTKVARSFGKDGIFEGVIAKHYDDDPTLCVVRYTDGDQEDMDEEEVSYAVAFFKQEFTTLTEVD